MKKTLLIAALFAFFNSMAQQDSARLFFNTGAGIIKVNPALHHVLKPAIAFNSGIELTNKKNWFLQGTLDFNTLKYNQHIKDEGENLLFTNTSSSLLIIGANVGKNFRISNSWFLSGYGGAGFLSIGEPRVMVENNIARQEIKRKSSAFGRGGFRVAKSHLGFLQTVYLDVSWWGTTLNVQNYKLTGFAFYLGTRMAVGK